MISEDHFHKGQGDIQTITDDMIKNVESLSEEKQKELMNF
jgi:ribosome recycling factor